MKPFTAEERRTQRVAFAVKPTTPFGLSLSKPSSNTHQPFDTGLRQAQSLLRANGGNTPFGLSLSKPSSNTHQPFDTGAPRVPPPRDGALR